MTLPERMEQAADILAEVNALYGFTKPEFVQWDPVSLRKEAQVLRQETPAEPQTITEQLDAAETGEEWGNALLGFMNTLREDQP